MHLTAMHSAGAEHGVPISATFNGQRLSGCVAWRRRSAYLAKYREYRHKVNLVEDLLRRHLAHLYRETTPIEQEQNMYSNGNFGTGFLDGMKASMGLVKQYQQWQQLRNQQAQAQTIDDNLKKLTAPNDGGSSQAAPSPASPSAASGSAPTQSAPSDGTPAVSAPGNTTPASAPLDASSLSVTDNGFGTDLSNLG